MTKESIFKKYLDDQLIQENKILSKVKSDNLRFIDQSGVKLIEVIKIAINGCVDGESKRIISRKINQFLNR